MGAILLIISAILFIATFGIHVIIARADKFDQPMYIHNPLMTSIPWISGFVLPVIPFSILFDVNWIAIFFINIAVVWLLGPMLTKAFLVRFASGKGLGKDMLTSFIAGIVVLIIGLLVNK
jgi:hypothetical protein